MAEQPTALKKPDVQFQTYSNREYINYVYASKYEDCVRTLVDVQADREEKEEQLFRKNLMELYWLVIVPRLATIPTESVLKKPPEFFDNVESSLIPIELDECTKILAAMSAYLYNFGVLRPETNVPDAKRIAIKRLEQKRAYHGPSE